MKKIFSVLFVVLTFFSLNAQNELDSLLKVLELTKNKSQKIEILKEISDAAINISFDSAIFYNKKAVELSKNIGDNTLIANNLLDLSKLYIYNAQYDLAIQTALSSITYSKKTNDKKLIALTIHTTGNTYLYKQKYKKGLQYYLDALEIREQINDTSGIAATTNNIGLIYWNLRQFEQALKYYFISLKNEKIISNYEGISSSYNNIGLVYWQIDKLDSAIFYIKKSLNMRLKTDDSNPINLSSSYNNLGVLFRTQEIYDSAVYYFKKSLQINKKLNFKHDIANSYNNIATCLYYQDRNYKALKYMDSSEVICTQLNDYKLLKNLYDLYAGVYAKQKKFDEAYKYLRLYIKYNDSLFNKNFSDKITEMQAKYEAQKRKQEIEMKNIQLEKKDTEIKLQRRLLMGFVIFLIIVITLSVFLFIMYKQKNKTNNLLTEKNAEILQQKEEIETQANNLQEAFAKIRLTNEKLQNRKKQIEKHKDELKKRNEFVEASIKYASTIQNASLPLKKDIDKYFYNFIIYLPKDIVSGDFYFFSNVKNLNNNTKNLFFVVSDCTGHGVPGAFMSMIGIRLLNKYINEYKFSSPAKILEYIDNDVIKSLKQEDSNNQDGMDMIICKFQKNSNKLIFAGAKRNLYYYSFYDNNIKKVPGARKSIGGISKNKKITFEDVNIHFNKNDVFYLFTDGFPDQNNQERRRFGTHRLLSLLEKNINKDFPEQQLLLLKELEKWQQNTMQRDDISFAALSLK